MTSVADLNVALSGSFEIEREIGAGGMATVYLARDVKHGRQVAIKMLRDELSDSVGGERFEREIRIAARLSHPHILTVHDSGRVGTHLFYVMPYVEGESLRDRLRRERQLPLPDMVRITTEVAHALTYAHTQGVVHRDIKPENILLAPGGAVVADFGIARAVTIASSPERLTSAGIAIGTPAYMSPEQAAGDGELSGRSDVYSLGCVVYEMLVGAPPFAGPTAQVVLARHSMDTAPRIRTARATVSDAMEAAVLTAIAKTPADRFATPTEFADALAAALTSPITFGQATRTQPDLRRRRRLFAGVAVVAALAAVAAPLYFRGRGDASATPMMVVLPFTNRGDANDQYFAEGITDEITSRLAQVPGLGVISRMSAVGYDARGKSIAQIGEDLGVQYVLSGSVQVERRADRSGMIHVIPHLTRVADQTEESIQPIDVPMALGEIVKAQGDIAQQVASTLNVTLQPAERQAMERPPTDNLEAYNYYLQASAFSSRPFAEEPTRHAIEMYQQATAIDPRFQLAFAKLAEAQSQYFFFFDRSKERLEKARSAVDHALAIDSTQPAARLARGYFRYWAQLDYDGALAEFTAVQRSRPNDSQLLWVMGSVLRRQGNWREALVKYTRAFELNPRGQAYAFDLGSTHLMLHEFPEAERRLDQAIALAPDWTPPHVTKAHLYLSWKGDTALVNRAMRDGVARVGWPRWTPTLVLYRYLVSVVGGAVQDSVARVPLPVARDSSSYYIIRAEWHAARGRAAEAGAYYDSARTVNEGRVRANPTEARFHVDLALAYAGLGRAADAARESDRAAELNAITKDAYFGTVLGGLIIQADVMAGRADTALARLTRAFDSPGPITRAMARADGHLDALRRNPKFEALLR